MKVRVVLHTEPVVTVFESAGTIAINVDPNTGALTLFDDNATRVVAAFAPGVWITARELVDAAPKQ